jgi:hypothetical protein
MPQQGMMIDARLERADGWEPLVCDMLCLLDRPGARKMNMKNEK